MLSKHSADLITSEARRLLSLAKDVRECEGIYATDHDLKELMKSLSSRGAGRSIANTDSLGRRVADLAGPESKLFQLVFAAIEGREK